jgi:hypothetical protein
MLGGLACLQFQQTALLLPVEEEEEEEVAQIASLPSA